MSVTAAATRPEPVPNGSRPAHADRAVATRAFKQVWIGATVCAVAFGATAASSALTYLSSFATEASRQQLVATTSADSGLAVLLGPVSGVDTPGGYMVYKGFVFLTTIGAIWALLAATRVLRGEEDTGRWQLVLGGARDRLAQQAATLIALSAAVAVVFVGATAIVLLTCRDPDLGFRGAETVLYGVSIVIPAAVFAAVGALTSQLGRNRRAATGLGMVGFAVAFVLRMVADSSLSAHWLLWTTPFGWTELIRPFSQNDLLPLLPAALTVLILGGAAVALSARRDVGNGVLASRDVAALRSFGLGSAFGLSVRLELPVLVAWCAGALASGLGLGIIAKMTATRPPESVTDLLDKFHVSGDFTVEFLGITFLLVATVVALLPASQMGAAAEEETTGRVLHLFARPVRPAAWFAGRLALTAIAVLAAGALAGPGAWIGAKSQGLDLDFGSLLGAGLNVVPTALLTLGIGAVVLSVAPRPAAITVYVVVGWSLIINILGSTVSGAGWLDHVSLFHYMALAPADDPDPTTLAVTTALAVALGAMATLGFSRRDCQPS